MLTRTWPCPCPGGGVSEEYALSFDDGSETNVLVSPPLFDEHNTMRTQIVAVMRALSEAGIDSVLPDLPGWNESIQPLEALSLSSWRAATLEAAKHFNCTHVLALRAGALLAPEDLPGWHYAPLAGAKQLRGMMRARAIAAREAGSAETVTEIADVARAQGVVLAGWHLSAEMFRELEAAEPQAGASQRVIEHAEIGGGAPWLRAEPECDHAQAKSLANVLAEQLA